MYTHWISSWERTWPKLEGGHYDIIISKFNCLLFPRVSLNLLLFYPFGTTCLGKWEWKVTCWAGKSTSPEWPDGTSFHNMAYWYKYCKFNDHIRNSLSQSLRDLQSVETLKRKLKNINFIFTGLHMEQWILICSFNFNFPSVKRFGPLGKMLYKSIIIFKPCKLEHNPQLILPHYL